MRVEPIASRLAREVVEREHYLHRKPTVSYAYGLFEDEELVGVCTFGVPAGRMVSVSACPLNPFMVVELNRLWVHDKMPKNSESKFVAACLAKLPPLIVISFADTRQGHLGIIYRALNFNYAGWTDMHRTYPAYDYVRLDGKYSSGSKVWQKKIPRRPKVRYWTTTGPTPWWRKWVANDCALPRMDWNKEPPPIPCKRHMHLPDAFPRSQKETRKGEG